MITIEGRKYVPAYLLTILRVYLGVILLYTVIGKIFADTPFVDEMTAYCDLIPELYVVKGQMVLVPGQ